MSTTHEPGESVDAREAIELLSCGEVWLLDVREPFEWSDSHAPGAHHIPMGDLGSRQAELPDDGTLIAVICHVGGRSQVVTDALVRADYPAVNVTGGMVAWLASGGDFVTGETGDRG